MGSLGFKVAGLVLLKLATRVRLVNKSCRLEDLGLESVRRRMILWRCAGALRELSYKFTRLPEVR